LKKEQDVPDIISIPLMQDATTTSLAVGVLLGSSIAMWVCGRNPIWLAIGASSFVMIYFVS